MGASKTSFVLLAYNPTIRTTLCCLHSLIAQLKTEDGNALVSDWALNYRRMALEVTLVPFHTDLGKTPTVKQAIRVLERVLMMTSKHNPDEQVKGVRVLSHEPFLVFDV